MFKRLLRIILQRKNGGVFGGRIPEFNRKERKENYAKNAKKMPENGRIALSCFYGNLCAFCGKKSY